jgi:hypothetical protein
MQFKKSLDKNKQETKNSMQTISQYLRKLLMKQEDKFYNQLVMMLYLKLFDS